MPLTFLSRPALLLFCALCLAASINTASAQKQAQGDESTKQAAATYRELVERAKKGDPTVDFVRLYSAYSDWEMNENHYKDAPGRDAMVEAFEKKDYKRASELAEVVLDYEYGNIGLHLATENAYRQLGDNAKAQFHQDVAQKLLNAMLSTGDGKGIETAYCVMSISDEYRIMRHFGYEVSSQAYYITGGSDYDSLSGKDKKTGKEATLFFDISGNFSRCVSKSKAGRN